MERMPRNSRRYFIYPGWISVLAALGFSLLFDPGLRHQLVPLALSAVILGLPHGAVDHLLLPKARDKSQNLENIFFVASLYLILGTIYLVTWFLNPAAAFLLFIAVTLFHWGEGEIYILEKLGADYLDSLQKGLTVLLRGSAPMLLPLAAFPDQYATVARILTGFFTQIEPSSFRFLFLQSTGISIIGFYSFLMSVTLGRGYLRSSGDDAWKTDTVEGLILTAYFLTVPPVLAIGIYFTSWHSLRHIFRYSMLDEDSSSQLKEGNPIAVFRKFGREALPLTLISLFLLGGIFLLVPEGTKNLAGYVGIYLILISILTPPHVILTLMLDREQDMF